MFKRTFLAGVTMLISSLLFAMPASAAPLSDYADYLTDDFYGVLHYQGSVDNPIRAFGDTLFESLEDADFMKKDVRKIMELADAHFLRNDLLFVADLTQEVVYMTIPMSAGSVDDFLGFIEQEEAVTTMELDGQTIYTSFKGDRFAFTYWDGALFVTDSQQSLSTILDDLKNNTESPFVSEFDAMPTDGFISAFVSMNGLAETAEEDLELYGDLSGLLDLNDFGWYVSRDLGSDHYVVEQYTSWNEETLQANDFDFTDFTFSPELYQKLPGDNVIIYLELNDIYDFAMGLMDLMNINELLEAESADDDRIKSGSSLRSDNEVLETIEEYRPYLELLNDRLGLVVQWTSEQEIPYVTFLTEVSDDDLETIRELNQLIHPFAAGSQCYSLCPEITEDDDREGARTTITQSLTQEIIDAESSTDEEGEGVLIIDYSSFMTPYERQYTFGEHNGLYVASNVPNIVEELDDPANTLASNLAFMDYFNTYTAGQSDISYLGFYDLSIFVEFALNSMPFGDADVTEAIAFLSEVGPWYTQGQAGTSWTTSLTELVLPIRSAIDSLVPLMVTQWGEEADYSTRNEYKARAHFSDLDDMDTGWYAEDLVTLTEAEIVDDSQDNFRPGDAISRAEFATLVVRHYGWEELEPTQSGSQIFDDVDEDAWYDEQIGLAFEYEILRGDDTGNTVRPNDPITRAEAAQVLVNVSGLLQEVPEHHAGFDDVPNDAWYSDAVDRTYNQEIVRGVSETEFQPSRYLTRAEAIVLINRIRERELRFDWVF